MSSKLKRPLLGILGAATAFGAVLGATSVINDVAVPVEAAAPGEIVAATFSSEDVVTSSGYGVYDDENWIITCGGNFRSIGTNKNSRSSKLNLDSYSKYTAGGSIVSANSSAAVSLNSIENVAKVYVSWAEGKSNTRGTLYLISSADDVTYQVLDSQAITSSKSYTFELQQATSGYFGIVFHDSSTSGDYRFDSVVAEYVEAEAPEPEMGALSSISIKEAPKSEYHLGDTVDWTGLVITASDGANSKDVYFGEEGLSVTPTQGTVLGEPGNFTAKISYTLGDVTKTVEFDYSVDSISIYYLGECEDFAGWTGSYSDKTLAYSEFSIGFTEAMKQTTTITDIPVTKDGVMTLTVNEGVAKAIKSIEVGFRQWTTKTKSISMSVNDGGLMNEVATLSFPSGGTSISWTDQSGKGFTEVKVDASSDDSQVGWEYVAIEWVDAVAPSLEEIAEEYAAKFLGELICDATGETAPSVDTWDELGLAYLDLDADVQKIFAEGTANETGTIVEQCLARYDYVLRKYGSVTYDDFMERGVEPSGYALPLDGNNSNTAAIAALGAVSLVALAFGSAVIIKKRKKQH